MKPIKPHVGIVYWYPRPRVDGLHMYKHEVRAIVDDHYVYKWWSLRKQVWFYGVEALWTFEFYQKHGTLHLSKASASAWAKKHWGRA